MVESSSDSMSQIAAAFLGDASACQTIEALDERFLAFARGAGFASAMFVHLSSQGEPIAPRVVFGHKSPWIAHYAERNYARLDPTIPRAFLSRRAFTWGAVDRSRSRRLRRFFGEAREVWAKDGLVVPIHGPFGEFSVVNLLSERRIRLSAEQIAAIQGVCHIYACLGLNLVKGPVVEPVDAHAELSRRERQCIYWMCVGKHDSQTARILGISAHTVRDYLDSAKLKLQVETRPEMSLRALAMGLLVPDRAMLT
jgi:DNA-binding CsgD family transcriptional regulator